MLLREEQFSGLPLCSKDAWGHPTYTKNFVHQLWLRAWGHIHGRHRREEQRTCSLDGGIRVEHLEKDNLVRCLITQVVPFVIGVVIGVKYRAFEFSSYMVTLNKIMLGHGSRITECKRPFVDGTFEGAPGTVTTICSTWNPSDISRLTDLIIRTLPCKSNGASSSSCSCILCTTDLGLWSVWVSAWKSSRYRECNQVKVNSGGSGRRADMYSRDWIEPYTMGIDVNYLILAVVLAQIGGSYLVLKHCQQGP